MLCLQDAALRGQMPLAAPVNKLRTTSKNCFLMETHKKKIVLKPSLQMLKTQICGTQLQLFPQEHTTEKIKG